MIAIGGLPPGIRSASFTADSWPQGIAVFDLTDMRWKDSYDPDAQAYTTPQQVKDDIATNGRYPQNWDNTTLQRLITGQTQGS